MKWIMKNKSTSEKGNYKVLAIIMVSLVSAFIVSSFVINVNRIVGISMEPTFKENKWVLINRIAYLYEQPEIDDVIIFQKKSVSNDIIVKRIVAVPGDSVEIRDGLLYINDHLREDDFNEMSHNENMKKVIVEKYCYFVLGDNRNHSYDSRFWDDPFVRMDEVIGKVVF